MEQADEDQIRLELRQFLTFYRSAVFSIARRLDKQAIDLETRDAIQSGRDIFTRLVGREPAEGELESLLALDRLEEHCRKFQS